MSGRLCGVILTGECYEQTDKPDTCREKFLDDAIAAAERASGKKLNQPNRHIVLNRARAQIELQRYADRQRALREERAAVRVCLVTSARAAPLIAPFGGLVVLTLRNRLPFTRVHSHAVAEKSSGAFFRVMARERCWKMANSLQSGAEGLSEGASKRCYGK